MVKRDHFCSKKFVIKRCIISKNINKSCILEWFRKLILYEVHSKLINRNFRLNWIRLSKWFVILRQDCYMKKASHFRSCTSCSKTLTGFFPLENLSNLQAVQLSYISSQNWWLWHFKPYWLLGINFRPRLADSCL